MNSHANIPILSDRPPGSRARNAPNTVVAVLLLCLISIAVGSLVGCSGASESPSDAEGTLLTDQEVKRIVVGDEQTALSLADTALDDDALAKLDGIERLTVLDLSGTQVTDRGLRHLARAVNLRKLNLSRTALTEAALSDLKRLPNLIEVKLHGTAVSRKSQLAMIRFLKPRYQAYYQPVIYRKLPADYSHGPSE